MKDNPDNVINFLNALANSQSETYQYLGTAFQKINDQEDMLNKIKKSLKRNSRSIKFNNIMSTMALTYLMLSTRILWSQGGNLYELRKEVDELKKKQSEFENGRS